MKNQYQDIFLQIIDSNLNNPTIIVHHANHLPRLRAGLNRCKKDHGVLASLIGEEDYSNMHFTYKHDKEDKSKVTISIIQNDSPNFIICK